MKFAPIAYYITGWFNSLAGAESTTRLVYGYAVQPDEPCFLRLCVRRTASPNRWVVDHWDTGFSVPIGAFFSRAQAVRSAVGQIREQEGYLRRQLRWPGARRARALVQAARNTAAGTTKACP